MSTRKCVSSTSHARPRPADLEGKVEVETGRRGSAPTSHHGQFETGVKDLGRRIIKGDVAANEKQSSVSRSLKSLESISLETNLEIFIKNDGEAALQSRRDADHQQRRLCVPRAESARAPADYKLDRRSMNRSAQHGQHERRQQHRESSGETQSGHQVVEREEGSNPARNSNTPSK